MKVKSLSLVQLFATPWTVAYQSPLCMGFSRQEKLEWVAISFSRGSSQPRDGTRVSRIASRPFNLWAPREAQIVPNTDLYQLDPTFTAKNVELDSK